MKIIVGHTNMDLDCLGSIVLARYLFPDHLPVKSRFVHPVARKVQNLYLHHIEFKHPKDLKDNLIERIVIVDTRSYGRVKEYFEFIRNNGNGIEIEIFDHHPAEKTGFPDAIIHDACYGANTTQLVIEIMKRSIRISPEDATIALTGIFADTGNFTHENVCSEDFSASSFLVSSGACLKLVKTFLTPLSARYQITLFHELLNRLEHATVHGHEVITSYWELEEEAEGIGAVVEKVFEVENQDLYFAVFHFSLKHKTLIIARNQKDLIDLNSIMKSFGGGGHQKAASATIRNQDGITVYRTLLSQLEMFLSPAVTAEAIMSRPVHVIEKNSTLLEASLYLERIGHTGLPVVDGEDRPVGIITLRDIMKGRRVGRMQDPVGTYMSRNLVWAPPAVTIREIEDLLFSNNIGHLPIVQDGSIVGIVTRTDYLNYARTEQQRRISMIEEMGTESTERVNSS